MSAKKALVLSYSPVARDPRVRRQIQWLKSSGFEVEVCGLGPAPCVGEASYDEIQIPSLFHRIVSYLFLTHKLRASLLVGQPLIGLLERLSESGVYDVVLLNDLDFLSVDALFSTPEGKPSRVAIDLHEYFYDLGGSLLWKILNSRYYSWLLSLLESRQLMSVVTVSDEIAELYRIKLGRQIGTVLNVPMPLAQAPTSNLKSIDNTPETIRIIHHGIYGKGRGIWRMLRAMQLVKGSFELHLMLVGSGTAKYFVQMGIHLLLLRDKVFLVKPVEFDSINTKLREFDLGLIFFHPPHSTSLRLAMPNKLFEFLNADLGLILGPSPVMKPMVEKWNLGVVSESWSRQDLAEAIDSLDRQKVRVFKENSRKAFSQFTPESLQRTFIKAFSLNNKH